MSEKRVNIATEETSLDILDKVSTVKDKIEALEPGIVRVTSSYKYSKFFNAGSFNSVNIECTGRGIIYFRTNYNQHIDSLIIDGTDLTQLTSYAPSGLSDDQRGLYVQMISNVSFEKSFFCQLSRSSSSAFDLTFTALLSDPDTIITVTNAVSTSQFWTF